MSKKIAIIILGVIALVTVAGVGLYLAQQRQDKEAEKVRQEGVATIPNAPEKSEGQPEEPVATKPIDTSDWKVYRNEDYKFELKYPKTWSEFQQEPQLHYLFTKDEQGITIYLEDSRGKSLWEFATDSAPPGGTAKCKKIKSGFGIPGVQCIHIHETGEIFPLWEGTWFTFFKTNSPTQDIVVIAPFLIAEGAKEVSFTVDYNPEIIDAIIKSFKYINR